VETARPLFGEKELRNAKALISLALNEDLGEVGDLTTTATIPSSARGAALLVARAPGVLAGLPVVERLISDFSLERSWEPCLADGDWLERGTRIARMSGSMRSLLVLERTILNFLQRLSGIATLTSRYVAAVAGTRAAILDTRKTTPGWRVLEKYAVRCGGGQNHRMGLYDSVMIKDNHLAWLQTAPALVSPGEDPLVKAIKAARAHTPPGTAITIEIDSLEQFDRVIAHGPDIILVDNLPPDQVADAVARRDRLAPAVQLEASGGINLATVTAMARTGVDRISVGALTHSAPALDLAMDFDFGPAATGDGDRRDQGVRPGPASGA
jgi:nicotinate-nucleotide pyrophosphorylase (carboxylating)